MNAFISTLPVFHRLMGCYRKKEIEIEIEIGMTPERLNRLEAKNKSKSSNKVVKLSRTLKLTKNREAKPE